MDVRMEILKRKAKENYDKDLVTMKVTVEGEISMVKNKLKEEHYHILSKREARKQDLDVSFLLQVFFEATIGISSFLLYNLLGLLKKRVHLDR